MSPFADSVFMVPAFIGDVVGTVLPVLGFMLGLYLGMMGVWRVMRFVFLWARRTIWEEEMRAAGYFDE